MATLIWTGDSSSVYSTSGNWSPAGVPATGDDLYIHGTKNIAGEAHTSVALSSFTVLPGYTGTIGDVKTALQIDTDAFDFAGRGESYIDLGGSTSSPMTIGVTETAVPSTAGQAGLYVDIVTTTGMILNVEKGDVKTPMHGSTAKFNTVNVGYKNSQHSDAHVHLDSGLTLDAAVNVFGGVAELGANVATVTVEGGTLVHDAGTITTLNVRSGRAVIKSTGTITTLNISGSGFVDYMQDGRSKTVTTLNVYGGAVDLDPNVVTVTNAVAANGKLMVSSI